MKEAEESWAAIPSKPSHMASSLGRIMALRHTDAAGKTRAARVLTVMYKASRKFPEKAKAGFVRLVERDSISHAYVRDLMGEAYHPDYDRQWHTVTYRDRNPRNCALANLNFRSKFAVRLEKRLRPFAELPIISQGSENNA